MKCYAYEDTAFVNPWRQQEASTMKTKEGLSHLEIFQHEATTMKTKEGLRRNQEDL